MARFPPGPPRSLEICTRGEAALIAGGPLGGRRSLIRLRLRSSGGSSTPRRLPQLTFTWMARSFASAFFGSVTVSTPFFVSALIFSASTLPGSVKERVNVP